MHATNNKGFTLIELLIVIAIFAIGSAIALPSLMQMGRRDQVKTEARQLKDQINRARAVAIEDNTSTILVFNADNYTVGATTVTLINTTITAPVAPNNVLTWDERGYPSNAIDIVIEGTKVTNKLGISVTNAGSTTINQL